MTTTEADIAADAAAFDRRWRIPDPPALRRAWLDDLSAMGEDCTCPGAYHRAWGLFKLAGRHFGLYRDAAQIRAVTAPLLAGGSQVLIVGSADALTLRLLADAGAATGPHAFTLVDRCPAALRLVAAAARRDGLALETRTHELGAPLALPRPADLVFGHFVLNFLPPDVLAQALASLRAALAPGGHVVIAHRAGGGEGHRLDDAAWQAHTMRRLEAVLPADDPAWPLARTLVEGYAATRRVRSLGAPFAAFEAAAAASGLRVVAAHDTRRRDRRSPEQIADLPDEQAMLYVLAPDVLAHG